MNREEHRRHLQALAAGDRERRARAEPEIARKEARLAAERARLAALEAQGAALEAELAEAHADAEAPGDEDDAAAGQGARRPG